LKLILSNETEQGGIEKATGLTRDRENPKNLFLEKGDSPGKLAKAE